MPTPANPESIDKAREALRAKMKELEGQQPAPAAAPAPASAAAPAVAKPTPAVKPAPTEVPETTAVPAAQPEKPPKKPTKAVLTFPTIPGPPPAISADKQQRLADLLRKYKADEITPEEYHQQRAKIMGEP
jgi:hypothetical protein